MASSQEMFLLARLIIGITSILSSSLAIEEDNQYRLFKDGHVLVGCLLSIHQETDENDCRIMNPLWIGHVEAILYAIEEINKNKTILPNLTLGYDIRDFCSSEISAARHAYQFATASTMNCKSVRCTSQRKCICDVNKTASVDEETPNKNYSTTYPVVGIVGKMSSQVAIPLANFLQAVRIPLIGSSATSEELSSPIYDGILRTIPSDINQAKAFADIIEHFHWRHIAAVAVDDSYGHYGVKALERLSIERKSFCVELFGYIPLSNYEEKLKTIVSSLKLRKTVRVIAVWSHSLPGKGLMMEATKQGLTNRVWIFSEGLAMLKPEFFSSILNLSSTGIHIGVKLQSEAPKHFLQYLKNKLVTNRSNEENFWWKKFWKSMALRNHSSNRSDDFSSNRKSTDELLQLVHNDFVIYIIDAVYSIAYALDRMQKCTNQNGSTSSSDETLCSKINNMAQRGKFIEYLKKVEFDGMTGKVRFDFRGDPVEAIYDIVYFNISERNGSQIITKNVIGRWDKKSQDALSINEASLPWKKDNKRERTIPSSSCTDECKPGQWKARISDCCWKCISCTDGSISETHGALNCTKCTNTQMSNYERTQCQPLPMTNIKWSDLLTIILTIASILGVVFGICTFIILFHFRDTPIVKALNKICTFGLLLGIALCFIMTLLYIAKPSSGLCSFLKPSRYVVYTLCCSALFLKTMQLVHAFNISGYKGWIKAFIFSTKRQVIVLSLIISMEVLLGAGWILIDPPYARLTIFPKSHVYITCVRYRGTAGKVFDNLMFVHLLLMAACCIYYAYRSRNLPANFNEAKYISFSLYIFLLSWITYYPIEYAVEGWYVAVLSGATLLLSSYGLLGCMFGPKLYIIICHPEKNTTEFVRAEMRQNNVSQSVNNSGSVRPISDKET